MKKWKPLRISIQVDDHSSVVVEANVTAIKSAGAVLGANDNASDLVAGFYFSTGDGFFYGTDDNVTEPGGSPGVLAASRRTLEDLDTLGDLGPGVVGNRYSCLHLKNMQFTCQYSLTLVSSEPIHRALT